MYRDATQDPKYGVPTYGMYNLATNYTPMYDISTYYTTDPEMVAQGYNNNYLLDEELERLTKEMVLVEPGDNEAFKAKFVDAMDRWNQLLPDLPLYSNIYHDFFNEKLMDWEFNSFIEIADALHYAWMAE